MHLISLSASGSNKRSIGTVIAKSLWLFPVIETVHILALFVSGGHIDFGFAADGLTFRDEAVSKLARRFLPGLGGFIIQVTTGLLMFSSEATKM